MASTLVAMASNLLGMASNLVAMASNLTSDLAWHNVRQCSLCFNGRPYCSTSAPKLSQWHYAAVLARQSTWSCSRTWGGTCQNTRLSGFLCSFLQIHSPSPLRRRCRWVPSLFHFMMFLLVLSIMGPVLYPVPVAFVTWQAPSKSHSGSKGHSPQPERSQSSSGT